MDGRMTRALEKQRRDETRPYRVGIVSAMWQRLDLTDMVFAHIAAMREAVASYMHIIPVVAGSEGEESRAVAEKNGFAYTEVENQPLGAKWNAALSLLRHEDVDGVVILGSDDVLNERFFQVLKRIMDEGCLLAGLDTFFVLEEESGRLLEWLGYLPPREGESIGAGRFLHRKILEHMHWHLWEDELNASLDASMWRLLKANARQEGWPFFSKTMDCRAEGVALVDVKSSVHINGFEDLALASGRVRMIGDPCTFLKTHYSQALRERFFSSGAGAPSQDVLIDTLAPFAVACPNSVPIVVILPHLPEFMATLEEQQTLALLTWLRAQGYALEFWTGEPVVYPFFKIDSGLRGQRIRNLADAMRDLPSSLHRVLVCGGWKKLLRTGIAIRHLRRNYEHLRVTADLRFSGREEAEYIASLADDVLPPWKDATGKAADVPLCLVERQIAFTGFDMRAHAAVFMEHKEALGDLRDIVHACNMSTAWKSSAEQLYLDFIDPMQDFAPQLGIFSCKSDNMQIFYRMFKVCIVPPRCKNPGICAEVLAAGTPLLCQGDLAHSMGLGEEDGVLAYSSWEEALRFACLLCTKRNFWELMAARAQETGARLTQVSNAAYAKMLGQEAG